MSAQLLLSSRLLSDAGFIHGFSLRTGGVSQPPFDSLNLSHAVGDDRTAVGENVARVHRAAGVEQIATAAQVHGDRLLEWRGGVLHELLAESHPALSLPANLPGEPADALLTREAGAAVGVRAADCVPILIVDPLSGGVAAVHSGWRGTKLAIAGRTAQALGQPRRLLAAIGPCVGRCCYEVSRELAAAFRERYGADVAGDPRDAAQPHLDLRLCIERGLHEAGLPGEQVEQVAGCTSCDAARFFSHRRDAGRTGRHLAFAVAGRPL